MTADQGPPFAPGGQFKAEWEISSDAEKTNGLKKILSYITTAEGGLSPERIHERMNMFMRDGYIPSHDTIRLIMKSKKSVYPFKNKNEYITLIYFIGRLSSEEKGLFNSLNDDETKSFRNYCDQYFEIRSRDEQFRYRYLLEKAPWATRSYSAAFDLLSTINSLGLARDSFLRADRIVFSEAEISDQKATEKHYFAYRFGVQPGQVFKSRITFLRQKGENSPVTFTHMLRNRVNDLRSTKGFVLAVSGRLYLIGNLQEGSALEILAFSNFNPQQTIESGLMMTVSAVTELLVGRVALKRTIEKPEDSEICRKPYDELKAELDDFKEMLANKVEFSLTRTLNFDGEKITQTAMVEEVAKLLKNNDGKPRFTYDDDTEFNPAASAEYTFNAALREFR